MSDSSGLQGSSSPKLGGRSLVTLSPDDLCMDFDCGHYRVGPAMATTSAQMERPAEETYSHEERRYHCPAGSVRETGARRIDR